MLTPPPPSRPYAFASHSILVQLDILLPLHLQLQACQYQQAAFCLEEVLSMGPLAPLTLLKYADVLATLGSPSQLKAARAYYSQALRVSVGVYPHVGGCWGDEPPL